MLIIFFGERKLIMSWTDERVALLKQLWGEGKTAAQIAKELGNGVTRNAVIGKAHRLKLSGRVSPIQQNEKTPVAKKEQTPQQPIKKIIAGNSNTKPPKTSKNGVKLADLKEKMCRWPVGDPREADFHFCGENAIPGLPYCETHAKIAYQVASKNNIPVDIDEYASRDGNNTQDTDLDDKVAVTG